MAASTRRRSAHLLLCLDVQPPFVAAMSGRGGIVQRCSFAVAAATGLGIPVAFTEQVPEKLGGTDPALLASAPSAPVWSKTAFSAYADKAIRDRLRSARFRNLLLCGLETPVCVYQTALDALKAGRTVTVLTDAVDARRPEDAAAALAQLARDGVRLISSETFFYEQIRDSSHPYFREFTSLVKKFS